MKHEGEETITARNSAGITREFTATQWRVMGKDKGGYKPAVPGEVDNEVQALQNARQRYLLVTGKEAPADKSADYLTGVSDMVAATQPAAQPATEPATEPAAQPATEPASQPGKPEYKRPRSTEQARELYTSIIGTEAPEGATFGDMVAEIEHTLGV